MTAKTTREEKPLVRIFGPHLRDCLQFETSRHAFVDAQGGTCIYADDGTLLHRWGPDEVVHPVQTAPRSYTVERPGR